MTILEYRKKTLVILFKVLVLLVLASFITMWIFEGAPMILGILVGLNNGWLSYKVHMDMLHQLNTQYFREQDEETG